jgi:hypothetical protein
MGYINKIKIDISKYDGLDEQQTIMWVNKIGGILAMNPLANDLEKILMESIYLEGDAYDWLTWWSKKTNLGYPLIGKCLQSIF